jgi:hypothetical protein
MLPAQVTLLMIKTKSRQEKTTQEKTFKGSNIAMPRAAQEHVSQLTEKVS